MFLAVHQMVDLVVEVRPSIRIKMLVLAADTLQATVVDGREVAVLDTPFQDLSCQLIQRIM
jgi:hypothetical protein